MSGRLCGKKEASPETDFFNREGLAVLLFGEMRIWVVRRQDYL